ncbi:MAG TPA: hypothetical protein VKR32_03425 [Puia sp.]|nr:hypothetical protein [Puia sp.]
MTPLKKSNQLFTLLFALCAVVVISVFSCNGSGSSASKDSSSTTATDTSSKMSSDTTKKMMDTTKKATDTGSKGGQPAPPGH